jgi:acetolactate synthase-1/2/3 large subunit
MLKPACKASITIDRIDRIPELVRRAYGIATSARPGPVNLNVPEDVCHSLFDFDERSLYANEQAVSVGSVRVRPDADLVDKTVRALSESQNPVLLVGGGIHLSAAYDELARLAELTGVPVASTISGKGAISEAHPLSLGIFGRYSKFANKIVAQADLLVIVGCRLGEIATNRWTLISDASRIIHIDIDPSETQKVYSGTTVWGDAKLALHDLAEAFETHGGDVTERTERLAREVKAQRDEWKAGMYAQMHSDETPISMARVMQTLNDSLPDNAIVVAEGGFSSHWSALLFDTKTAGRSFIANRGHAAIGYGLPAAMGAKLAAPDRPVIALCGDGGFGMSVGELETLSRIGLPITVVVINNLSMGYVKALQNGLYEGRYMSSDLSDTDYGELAQIFGCRGLRVESPDDLTPAILKAMEVDVATVLDVRTTTDPGHMLPSADPRMLEKAG